MIPATNTYIFEAWLIQNYPDLFEEWELEISEYLDLDEWLDREHFQVINEWFEFRKERPMWRAEA